MHTVVYYKFGSKWFLDFPEHLDHGGDEGDLERVGAFHDFLELAANGEGTVTFLMDRIPFEGSEAATWSGTSGSGTGAYYTVSILNGVPVDLELWFNTLLFYDNDQTPPVIYFRQI